ncbi:hypothetical protein L915_02602 [Phytophthora nicotianae]|uniref:Uncharacterized protein n=2 Tax=Phytophthora nicotianae TaxID=4792 RepID=W2HGE2_PHYNI|nr:hypothetical protein L915_02602 [Phytophthora nicotianae]ETL47703.1 hypothetical protein L916_02578 [Phytophthora nicotianae]
MNEGIANGPVCGLTRPPLPPKPRASNRSRKQREREVPDVDWERSLQHFAAAVSDDLDDLHARFLQENELTFAGWKRLWTDARMSAAFHVEFWESSPTNTHKTILQQTLDALVCCIEERDGVFESAADVGALISRVFALYCAYTVQLGNPKHKIDVDPQSWTALLTINFAMCGAGSSLFPTAAREVRAMMHRLVVEENALLRCLQGFGPSVRVRNRVLRVQTAGVAGAGQDVSLSAASGHEEDAPVKKTTMEQLKALNDRYQELMSRSRSAAAATSAGLSGRRSKPTLSASLTSSTQEAGNGGHDLDRALAEYVEYKANEEVRRRDRIVRAVVARKYDKSRNILEQTSSDGRSNGLDRSDRSSVASVPLSPMAAPASITRDRSGSEDFLAELESELHADISSEQVDPATTKQAARTNQTSILSEISEADSDALADLERELEQSVGAGLSQNGRKTNPKKSSSPARRKRGRSPANTVSRVEPTTTLATRRTTAEKQSSAISEISEADSDAFADLERELGHSVELVSSQKVPEQPSPPPQNRKRGRDFAAPGIVPRKAARTASSTQKPARPTPKRARSDSVASTMSWAAASMADSDGLAEIQAELDAIPTLAGPLETAPVNPSRGRKTQQRSSDGIVHPATKSKAKTRVKQPTGQFSARGQKRKPQAVDVDDRLNHQVQSTHQRPERRTNEPSTVDEVLLRRSSRLSSVASEADSNALEELERELNATAATLGAAPSLSAPAPVKATPQKRNAPVKRSTRNITKKQRPNETHISIGKQRASKSNPKAPQESSRMSFVSSDNESDGLTELVAELDTVATQTSTTVKQMRPDRSSTSGKKATVSALSHRVLEPAVPAGLRRSARLSSVASDTESDGLEDLMAELDSTPAASKLPTTRPRVTRKQQTRKSKSSQAKEGPNTRKPRALPAPTKQKRVAMRKASTSQAVAAPVSSRRSTRSSSAAFDTDSDGLAELEAELQAGPT